MTIKIIFTGVCKFCGKICKNHNSQRNHERLCNNNPNKQISNFKNYDRIKHKGNNQYTKAKELGLPKPKISIETSRKLSEANKSRSEEWNKSNGEKISKTIIEKSKNNEWHCSLAKRRKYNYNGIELHGKWYEQAYRGNMYSGGMISTALSANTITLTATTTPIIGLWNPLTSTVNCVVSKAKCLITVAGNSAVAPGAFMWATSTNNGVISTGLTPLNRKTLALAGSQAKYYTIATALTGITNNLVIQHAAGFGTLVMSQGATGTPIFSGDGIEEFDGSLIVPPGGVLALLNTTSTTTISVASMILWEEIPV